MGIRPTIVGTLAVLGLLALPSGGTGLERFARQTLSGVISVVPEGRSGRPSLALEADGRPLVAWQECADLWSGCGIAVMRYDGRRWLFLGDAPLRADPNGLAFSAAVAVDPQGRPLVAWDEANAAGSDVYVARFEGETWRQLGEGLSLDPTLLVGSPALALTPDGDPVVAWSEGGDAFDPEVASWVYVKRFRDGRWELLGDGSLNVDADRRTGFPTLAVDGDGRPVVAWSERVSGTTRLFVKRWSGDAWQLLGGPLYADSHRGVQMSSLGIDPANRPVVAWDERSSFPSENHVFVGRFEGEDWELLGEGPIDLGREHEALIPSLAVAPDGRPLVAWHERATGGGVFLVVKRYHQGAWEVLEEPVESWGNGSGLMASLAVDADGRLLLAWQRRTPEGMKVMVGRSPVVR